MEPPRFENQSDCERYIEKVDEEIAKLTNDLEHMKVWINKHPKVDMLKRENEELRKRLDTNPDK